MVKDFKYIIKRIIIGVGIALCLMCINGSAKEISSVWAPFQNNVQVISNLDNSVTFPFNQGYWSNWGFGNLRFNFSIIKVSGDPTAPLAVVKQVAMNNYVCDVGSTTIGNSTFTGQTYSVNCPMIIGSNGLESMTIFLDSNQQNSQASFRITLGGLFTFEKVDDVNVDFSGTNNTINNQTSSINNNQNQNTQNIINNNNTNTQSIINNQNNNTQQQIESQQVCSHIDKLNVKLDNIALNSSGTEIDASSWGVTDYINIFGASLKVLDNYSSSSNRSICFYNVNKEKISCSGIASLGINTNVSLPTNSYYMRVSISTVTNKPQFELCKNGNQAISDAQQETTNSINNVNNTLNDSTGVANNDISDLFGDLESSDTPISDLVTMPITLLQAYISGMNGTCQSINLGRLYGTYLILPCITISNYIGSDLWGVIDLMISMFLIYQFSQLLITAFDSLTSLKDNFDWLYGVDGKHVGAPTSRVERNSDLY